MPLLSEFKKNPQLVACAESDPAHIGRMFNAKGEHVKLIRKALNAWLDREDLAPKPAKLDETLDVYDDQVAKRVTLYNFFKNILENAENFSDSFTLGTDDFSLVFGDKASLGDGLILDATTARPHRNTSHIALLGYNWNGCRW